MITWITGDSGSGKTTLAHRLRKNEVILDGDEMRGVWTVGFSREDRWEHNLRIARLAKLLAAQGFDIIIASICPFRELRREVQEITGCRFIYLEGGRTGKEYPYEK